MKKLYIMLGISILLIATGLLYEVRNPKVQESITFFPIDPNVTYKVFHTSVNLVDQNTLLWSIDSILDRKAYLRQDVGLLFSNGRLIGELGNWKQNTSQITQKKQIHLDQSAYFEAITFHHAELHEKGGQIFSSQAMSADQLYVIHSSSSTTEAFRKPKSEKEQEWKQNLDERTERMLQYSWTKEIRHFSIPLNEYQGFPLTRFNGKAKVALLGFSKKETERIEGNLWEGLYKNYFLGIKKADGTSVSPMGSTIPLILVAKNKTHLLVLTETLAGEPILLRQRIEDVD